MPHSGKVIREVANHLLRMSRQGAAEAQPHIMLGRGVFGHLAKRVAQHAKRTIPDIGIVKEKFLGSKIYRSGTDILNKTAKQLGEGNHPHDLPVDMKDLGIPIAHGKKLLGMMNKYIKQNGGSVTLAGGKFNLWKSTKKFFAGKTKVKPSTVLGGLSTALTAASFLPIPGAATLGTAAGAAGAAASAAKMAGRGEGGGVALAGGCPKGKKKCDCGVSGDGIKLAGDGMKRRSSKIGTKQEVWEGLRERTSGGLRKEHLMMNGKGKVVSIKRHQIGQGLVKKFGFQKVKA